jgi:hypothetical protein
MNAESFAALLKEYAQLYQLPLEELRTMAMQYPYCHNLQVLLQEKVELDQHPDRDKTLAKAATYAIDRKHLYRRLKLMREKRTQPKAGAYEMNEDFLELKDLNAVQADLEKIALGTYEDPALNQTMVIEPTPPGTNDNPEPSLSTSWEGSWQGVEEEPEETALLVPPLPPSPTPNPNPESIDQQISEPPSPTNPEPSVRPIAPTPKKAFSSWSQRDQSAYLQTSIQQLLQDEHFDPKKYRHLDSVHSKNEVNKKAWQSIADSDQVASETWAQLLLAQKQYHKAIEVYERLMLLIPEKSSFFAAQIESIKKSLS